MTKFGIILTIRISHKIQFNILNIKEINVGVLVVHFDYRRETTRLKELEEALVCCGNIHLYQ
eukprot:UN02572